MYKWVCYLTLVIHAVRHRDEAAAKFDAGKEFSLLEQIGREFAKLRGQSKGPDIVTMNMWTGKGNIPEHRNSIMFLPHGTKHALKNQCTSL